MEAKLCPVLPHYSRELRVVRESCHGKQKALENSYFTSIYIIIATFCTSLHFASKPLHSHIFLECGKMRQISASNRSQNVVKIAIIDYCNFGRLFLIILPYPSISCHRKNCWPLSIFHTCECKLIFSRIRDILNHKI